MNDVVASDAFPHLPKAPIVEAVLDFRSPFRAPWNPDDLRGNLVPALGDYPDFSAAAEQEVNVDHDGDKQGEVRISPPRLTGLRFRGDGNANVVQFMRDGFSFSRLTPYKTWEQFSTEAIRLWTVFRQSGQHDIVQRIGTRFINRILLPKPENGQVSLKEHFYDAPRALPNVDWKCTAFFHRTVFRVPGSIYAVNINMTAQAPEAAQSDLAAILIDIDVYTVETQIQPDDVEKHLPELRRIKNLAFFNAVKENTIGMFK